MPGSFYLNTKTKMRDLCHRLPPNTLEPEYVHPRDRIFAERKDYNEHSKVSRFCSQCKVTSVANKVSGSRAYSNVSEYENLSKIPMAMRSSCYIAHCKKVNKCTNCVFKTEAKKVIHGGCQHCMRKCKNFFPTNHNLQLQPNVLPFQQSDVKTHKNRVLYSSPLYAVPEKLPSERLLKKWGSEDSLLFIKNAPRARNLSDFKRSPKGRRVSISNSTEILYDTPVDSESIFLKNCDSPTSSSRLPLKSALKATTNHHYCPLRDTHRQISSGISVSHLNGNDTDVYDPSLPHIPIFDEEQTSLDSTALSQFSESGDSRSSSSLVQSARSWDFSSPDNKNLSKKTIASISPALNEWHQALRMTARLGWAIILYLAVRSHYNPLAFAKLLFKVYLFIVILNL